jgi:hypothetical protein
MQQQADISAHESTTCLHGLQHPAIPSIVTSALACREAVKRLRLDRDPDPKVQLPVHASIAALLCWRYAQLVTALPKRWTTSS